MSRVKRDKEESNRKIWLLLFVAISIFCLIFFAVRGRFNVPLTTRAVSTVLAPFQRITAWVGSQANYAASSIWEIMTVHQQNKMLRNEVNQLRAQNIEASEAVAENQRLRALLGYKQAATQFDLLPASVIGRESATWTSMITVSRGTTDGVRENMAVITEKGLVGSVVEVSPYSSKVRLLLDPRSSVGTLVQRGESRVAGIVEGDPGNPLVPRMVNIPRNADVVEGDAIVTSGFGGVYPKGIIVGTVASIQNDTGGLLKYAILDTAVDFQKLEDVAIIVVSREAPPEPLKPPTQTPGTETDPAADKAAQNAGTAGGAAR